MVPGGVDGDDGLNVLEVVDLGVGSGAGGCLDGQEEGLVGRNLSENVASFQSDKILIVIT